MTRLVVPRERKVGQPYIYMYNRLITQPSLDTIEYLRKVMDDLIIIEWRPYQDYEEWREDMREMPYVFMRRYMIGHTQYVIKWFICTRVLKKYEKV